VTASFLDSSSGLPVSGSLGQAFEFSKVRSARLPASSEQGLKGPITCWSSEKLPCRSRFQFQFLATACVTITGLPPPFTSGTAFQAVSV